MRDLKLNPEKGGTYYRDSLGRHHLWDPVNKVCLDGYTEGDQYDAITYEDMEEKVKHLQSAPSTPVPQEHSDA